MRILLVYGRRAFINKSRLFFSSISTGRISFAINEEAGSEYPEIRETRLSYVTISVSQTVVLCMH